VEEKGGNAFRGRSVGVRPTTADGVYEVYYRHFRIKTIDLSTMSPNARP